MKIFRTILYSISGFFIYTACILSFANEPMKLWLILPFIMVGLLFMLVASAMNRFRLSKLPIGTVFLSAGGTSIFTTIISLLYFQQLEIVPQDLVDSSIFEKRDYFTGAITNGIFLILGVILVATNKKK